ncbi:hypothetical protein [Rhizobium sp. FY34]|uniref:hypothetical protein n=1 Tax=Rhizobium sp. FY34 TaxID=2562309 RepID=UPI0010C00EF8|nr:hypothetical protein [Rhizobium sp. FY34]
MNTFLPLSLVGLLALSGCNASGTFYEPFPESLTYGGRSPIVSAPVGSSFSREVRDEFGARYEELYEVQPDQTVRIVTRFRRSIP